MLTLRHRVAVVATTVAAATAGVAAPAAAQPKYVAPTSATILSSTEERQDDPPVHLIFVENHSTVPVTVFSVSLTGCENVRASCSPRPVKLRLSPGQRQIAMRVEPKNPALGFGYHFGFAWRADSSSIAAVAAIAAAGDPAAQAQIAAMRRADSLDRAGVGPRVSELTRGDFAAVAARAFALRAVPDSLRLVPGERTTLDRVRVVLVDSLGNALGGTRWLRWQLSASDAVQFASDRVEARAAGRAVIRLALADEAQALLARPVPELDVPIVVAYPADPHAPTFAGIAVDADRRTPLACAGVALEDSAQNVVARGRTNGSGAFTLATPRAGTYRVRVEAPGWVPVYGPDERAAPDEVRKQQYPVRFTDQLLLTSMLGAADEMRHASPVGLGAAPTTPAAPGAARRAPVPVVRNVAFVGSGAVQTLALTGGGTPGTTWVQFVVDSAGRVEPASVTLPPTADAATVAAVQAVLARVRFSPARRDGTPFCELLRMPVTIAAP